MLTSLRRRLDRLRGVRFCESCSEVCTPQCQTGVPLRAGSMASDNRRYAAAGLPAIGIGMGVPGYQTPAETPDRVDPATLVAATRLVVATVHHLVRRIIDPRRYSAA